MKGIANLRVADASVMRHVTSGNTNSPSIMIGEKAADLIRGKDTVMAFRKQIKHLKLLRNNNEKMTPFDQKI